MRALSLRQNFAWTLTGQVVYAATQWGIITLLARQGTAAMVGEYALALAIAAPIVIFLNLKLRAVQASDARDEYAFSDYLGLRILTSLISTLVIAAIALIGDRDPGTQLTIIVLGLAKAFESISDILFGLQQKHERMDLVARSTIVKGLLALALFYAGFTLSGEVYGGAIGVATAWLATLLFIDVPLARRTFRVMRSGPGDRDGIENRFRPRFYRPTLRSLVWLTLPLGITVTLGSLSSNIPRYFIDHMLGASDLGVYAAMIYPLTASSMVISSLAQSAMPRLSTSFQHGRYAAFRSLLIKLMTLGTVLGLAGILVITVAGQEIIRLLYGPAYTDYHSVFIWVMVNAAIGYAYVFLGTALNAMRKFRIQLPIHVVSVAALTLLCWPLIARWGFNGALLALTVTAVLEATMYIGIVSKEIRDTTHSSLDTGSEAGRPLIQKMKGRST